MNRRQSLRFELQMPVICRWKDHRGSAHEIGGFSRDISTAGVFVLSSAPPPEGTNVAVEVLFPALGGATSQGLQLQSDGEVIRVDRGKPAMGFAIRCDFISVGGQEGKSVP